MKKINLPGRQVHLDFHTGPKINDVATEFDAREFARTMKRAHVNSVTVFAKCHHGHLYYNSKRPERHPGLRKNFDLLAKQVEALHREGIRAPIYLSVLFDQYAANTHPEWVGMKADGGILKRSGIFGAGYTTLDMNSPYQEYVADQLTEILARFKPVDGIFFDMCWDQPSYSTFAINAMIKAGLDPRDEHAQLRHARKVTHAYMKRFYHQVKASSPKAGVFFNSGKFLHLKYDVKFMEQVEFDALATSQWGHMYFPINVRLGRRFGKEYMGMTGRFNSSWGDVGSLKPDAGLEWEISRMISHGAKCSIGDQLHPRGRLDAATYELIGKAFQRVAEREPWLEEAKPVIDIGLFQGPPVAEKFTISPIDEGATRMLSQLGHQFDVALADDDFLRYQLLVLPDSIHVDRSLAARLRKYLSAGGKILSTGYSGLSQDGKTAILPELGITTFGPSPFTGATYIRFGKRIAADVPKMDHVMYAPGLRVRARRASNSLATVVEPYFNRSWDAFCSHKQTPEDRVSSYSAAVVTGKSAYIPYPIFSAFATHGNYPFRLLVRNVINLLMPNPILKITGPTGVESSVMRQRNRTIVHLSYYSPERRAARIDIIEDIIPLYRIPISLRLPRAPKRVYLAPGREALRFTYADGRVQVIVPEVRGHEMVVFE